MIKIIYDCRYYCVHEGDNLSDHIPFVVDIILSTEYFNGIQEIIFQDQGWLSPQQKGISPLPWGETEEKNLSAGEKWQKLGRNFQMCLF